MLRNEITPESINKIYKKGQDALKTSFFSLKFKPDFLTAVHYLTDAAKGFKRLRMFKESIKVFEEAIKCNKELLESWAEALNWQEIADIYIFELNDFNNGWKYLKNSSMSYKYSGKFTSSIKVYSDFAQRLIEHGARYPQATTTLNQALEDCFDQVHDELVRISMEEVFTKLLDVLCFMENYHDAINLIEKYIKIQKSIKGEKKHKISKNYLKLAMLRVIIDELYMAENLQDEMLNCYDPSCSDDIDDLRRLIKAFKDANKKEFNYLITYAFSLFQNNLLKSLKKVFDLKLEQQMNNQNLDRINEISVGTGNLNLDSSSSHFNDIDETKANTVLYYDIEGESDDMDSGVGNLEVQNNNAADYL